MCLSVEVYRYKEAKAYDFSDQLQRCYISLIGTQFLWLSSGDKATQLYFRCELVILHGLSSFFWSRSTCKVIILSSLFSIVFVDLWKACDLNLTTDD